MTLAIEPMINAGGSDVWMADDRWSISTDDDSLSAHFEHTVAITDNGPLVLTTARGRTIETLCYDARSRLVRAFAWMPP